MANNTIQEVSCVTAKWDIKPAQPHQNAFSTGKFPEPGLLNETMEVVKEKVWSFRHALKGVAEAFCRMGVSPTVVGYSSVPLHEDGYVIEHSEDVLALSKVDADEDKPSLKPTILLLRNLSDHSAPENDNLLREEDEREEDIDHGFAESSRKKLDERKSLTRSGGY